MQHIQVLTKQFFWNDVSEFNCIILHIKITYWQHPNDRISSNRWAKPLVGGEDNPSSKEVDSPNKSSTLMPWSMINGILGRTEIQMK